MDVATNSSPDEQSEFNTTHTRALQAINSRPHTEHEMVQKFKRWRVDAVVGDNVLQFLKEEGLINDAQYASQWLDIRVASQPCGPRYARLKLMQRGIKSAVIDDALRAFYEQHSEKSICEAALAKFKRTHRGENSFDKTASYLARRGFSGDVIYTVLKKDSNE